MAVDKREGILVRLHELLTELAGDDIHVYRNQAAFETDELPAYALLDGVETKEYGSTDKRGPSLMVLQPEIFYVPVPTENPKNTGVGPAMSTKRNVMIKKIMSDGTLLDLLGANGYMEYRGMETDMQAAADEVKGRFKLNFGFAYVLNVNKL